MNIQREPGSFRDPRGFVYWRDGRLYRQVHKSFQTEYEALVESGLLKALWDERLLIPHSEEDCALAPSPGEAFRVLRPEIVSFISYPYEWCFSAYRDAALATLEIQQRALAHGMVLKDASAYNIQFCDGRPVFIDTLSFERYQPGTPWIAYRQFCQHFLAPLALMARRDVRLSCLMKDFIDGVPLDLATRLLGPGAWFSPRLLLHIVIHSHAQRRHAGSTGSSGERPAATRSISKTGLLGLIESLRSAVAGLKWSPSGTEWADYYEKTNYSDAAFEAKRALIESILDEVGPASVWDLGANDGTFSRLASERAIPTVAFDIDPAAVEKNYRRLRAGNEAHLLPLTLDLTNPSPSLGWESAERKGILSRGPAELVLALALIHHLAISNNVPLERIAEFMAGVARELVIEFVPKEDSQVRKLLSSREDVFNRYTIEEFEKVFGTRFAMKKKLPIPGTCRTLFWMSRL